jgi:hypothetical protein
VFKGLGTACAGVSTSGGTFPSERFFANQDSMFVTGNKKTQGTLSRPLSLSAEEPLLLLCGLFLFGLFLGCHVAILPFHCSWMRSKLKTAIDDCIE